MLRRTRDRHGDPMRQQDAGRIADVARFVIEHLVARVHDRAQRDVQRFTDADGDQDLFLRVVRDAEFLCHVTADCFAQLEQAEV